MASLEYQFWRLNVLFGSYLVLEKKNYDLFNVFSPFIFVGTSRITVQNHSEIKKNSKLFQKYWFRLSIVMKITRCINKKKKITSFLF